MQFNFPKIKFVDSNGLVSQIEHIYSEALEIKQAVLAPDIDHTAEEIMDCLHSCETALRILSDRYGISLCKTRAEVQKKNELRGYYAQP